MNRRIALLLGTTTALLALPGAAQDFKMAVAPEVGKLQQLIGTWEGSGTMRKGPDAPAEKWTGNGTAKWVLGGHFVQQDLDVHAESADGTDTDNTSMRVVYGWDRERQCYVALSLGTEQPAILGHGACPTADTTVFCFQTADNGVPVQARWIYERESADRHTVRVEHSIGSGPMFVCFEGTYHRAEEVGENDPDGAEAREASLTRNNMDTLAFLLGTWSVQGSVLPNPDKAPVEIAGTETISRLFGGTVLAAQLTAHATRDETDTLEKSAYFAWNPQSRAYDYIWMTSCGHLGMASCAAVDAEHLTMAGACTVRNKPLSSYALLTKHARGGQIEKIELEHQIHYAAKTPTTCVLKFEKQK